MKTIDVIGKRIVAVAQDPVCTGRGHAGSWGVRQIVLEDGTRIVLRANESEFQPYVTCQVYACRKEAKR